MRTAARAALAALVIAEARPLPAGEPRVPIPPDHFTRAELDGFRSIATYDEVVAFCGRLAKTSPAVRLEYFGTSGQGRKMPVVLVSKEKEFDPAARWKSRKPWVLLLGSIHGGEVDGTEAILELLRDVALTNRPEILDAVNLLAVPVYNVDGYARVGRWNRPNQNGPAAGMGVRTNARGYDLNRDFLKADAPETRALLALVGAWSPDLFVDNHVTDGADFQPTLTVAFGHEPVTPAPLRAWLDLVVPKALRAVEEWGFLTAPYIDFVDDGNPLSGIAPDPFGPRYSTGYFALRNVPSILVETHAIKPFDRRVKANALFLAALLDQTGRNGAALLSAREKARAGARGAPAGSPVVVAAATDREKAEALDLPTYVWTEEISPVTGRPAVRYDTEQKTTVSIPLYRHAKPVATVPRPAAYLVPAGWSNLEERLKAHGVRYVVLPEARTLELGTFRAKSPTYAARPYQGRTRVTASIERATETREVAAGSLYVPLDTELAPLVVFLLEPEGTDSLFAWGEMTTALEPSEYIDLRVLDPLAAKMLKDDPALKVAWEEKLRDPAFAEDGRARREFFHRRTPYREESLGLLPVYRLSKPLPDLSPAAASAGGRG